MDVAYLIQPQTKQGQEISLMWSAIDATGMDIINMYVILTCPKTTEKKLHFAENEEEISLLMVSCKRKI